MSSVINRMSSGAMTMAKKNKSEMVSKLLRKWVSTNNSAVPLKPVENMPWKHVATVCQLFNGFASQYVSGTKGEEPYIHASDLEKLFALFGIDVPENQAAEMVEIADGNGDGKLQLNEFLAMLDWQVDQESM